MGYRKNYNMYQALLSLFSLHNETMNIWSHLIAFICTMIAGLSVAMEYQAESVALPERLCLAIYILSACTCLLCSAIYHWFSCVSESHYYYYLKLDLTGIAILIAGSFFPATYYGFYCTPGLQKIYMTVATLILVIGKYHNYWSDSLISKRD